MENINYQFGIFKFESDEERQFNELRTIRTDDGDVMFCGIDAARMIGYKRPSDAISQHARHSVKYRVPCKSGSYIDNNGKEIEIIKEADLLFIPDSDLFRLILKSQLPSADRFETWIVEEVLPSIRKKGYYGDIDRTSPSNYILRYDLNYSNIEPGYFSVISELFTRLYVKFHSLGYDIPDKSFEGTEIRPDVSVGKRFSKYLKDKYPQYTNCYKTYKHKFPNLNIEVNARQYKNEVWPIFIAFVESEWIPKYSYDYFKDRDKKALEYLPKLISTVNPTKKELPNNDSTKDKIK